MRLEVQTSEGIGKEQMRILEYYRILKDERNILESNSNLFAKVRRLKNPDIRLSMRNYKVGEKQTIGPEQEQIFTGITEKKEKKESFSDNVCIFYSLNDPCQHFAKRKAPWLMQTVYTRIKTTETS